MLNAANFARVQAAKGRKVLALTRPHQYPHSWPLVAILHNNARKYRTKALQTRR